MEVFRSSPIPYSDALQEIAKCHESGNIFPDRHDAYWEEMLLKPVTTYSSKTSLLAELLRKETYDFIHVLGMQEGAYLLRKALEEPNTTTKGAKVIYSLWGNDIYYFWHFPEHREEIIKALPLCDRLHADAERDTHLARQIGYKGEMLPVCSAITSAIGLQNDVTIYAPTIPAPSQRTKILIRGTNIVRGRGVLAIEAFQRLPASLKKKFTLSLINTSPMDMAAAYRVTDCAGITAMTGFSNFDTVLKLLSESRCTVSLNTTDGTPQFFWEAAATHCYPIFSKDTGLGVHFSKENGMPNMILIDPNDIHQITQAIELALTSDALVDTIAPLNQALLHRVQSPERMAELFRETYK